MERNGNSRRGEEAVVVYKKRSIPLSTYSKGHYPQENAGQSKIRGVYSGIAKPDSLRDFRPRASWTTGIKAYSAPKTRKATFFQNEASYP
jgi:hypothetical protein